MVSASTLLTPDPNPESSSSSSSSGEARHIPASLLDALITQESAGDPNAVSPAGAKGLAQSMDHTARDPGFGVEPLKNPFDPEESRRFADEYMGAMLQRFDDPGHALMAYNWGYGNVRNWMKGDRDTTNVPKETRDYVRDLGPKAVEALGREIDTPFFSRKTRDQRKAAFEDRMERKVILDAVLSRRSVAPADATHVAQSNPTAP